MLAKNNLLSVGGNVIPDTMKKGGGGKTIDGANSSQIKYKTKFEESIQVRHLLLKLSKDAKLQVPSDGIKRLKPLSNTRQDWT